MNTAVMKSRLSAKEIALAWYKKFGYVVDTRWVCMHRKFKIDVYYQYKGMISDCFSMNLSASGDGEDAAWKTAVMNICLATAVSIDELTEEAELMAVSNDLKG